MRRPVAQIARHRYGLLAKGHEYMRVLSLTAKRNCIIAIFALLTIGGVITIYQVMHSELFRLGQHLGPLGAHLNLVSHVTFSPDGKTLASASNDKTAKLWDVTTGQLKHILKGHSGSVWQLAFSPKGDILASGSRDDKSIITWDTVTTRPVATLSAGDCESTDFAFSSDGKLLACSGGSPPGVGKLWDATTLTVKRILAESQCIVSFAPSPDNTILAGGYIDGGVGIWDVSSGKRKGYFSADRNAISLIAFTPDGAMIMTGTRLSVIKMWSAGSLALKSTINAHPRHTFYCAAISPNSRFLATGGEVVELPGPGPGEISLWDMQTGKELAVIGGFRQPITTVAFSPDSSLFASGSYIGGVQIWNVAEVLEERGNRDIQEPESGTSLISGERVDGTTIPSEN